MSVYGIDKSKNLVEINTDGYGSMNNVWILPENPINIGSTANYRVAFVDIDLNDSDILKGRNTYYLRTDYSENTDENVGYIDIRFINSDSSYPMSFILWAFQSYMSINGASIRFPNVKIEIGKAYNIPANGGSVDLGLSGLFSNTGTLIVTNAYFILDIFRIG